jgi:hypothetical protein
MKVKIGNKIYSAEDQPIMVILTKGEQNQVANLCEGCTKYCQYPTAAGWTEEAINAWMDRDILCGRCSISLSEKESETCWWCTGELCYSCWDEYGHCGHEEADRSNELGKAVPQPGTEDDPN